MESILKCFKVLAEKFSSSGGCLCVCSSCAHVPVHSLGGFFSAGLPLRCIVCKDAEALFQLPNLELPN